MARARTGGAGRQPTVGFLAFSASASRISLGDDLFGLNADQAPAEKRHRPFAFGALRLEAGLLLAPLRGLLALAYLGRILAHFGVFRLHFSLYSGVRKTLLLLMASHSPLATAPGWSLAGQRADMRCRSGGSPFLSGLLFLSLALMKRLAEPRARPGRGYVAQHASLGGDRAMVALVGVTSFSAAIVLALIIQSASAAVRCTSPGLFSALVPLAQLRLCRMWLSTAQGYMRENPSVSRQRTGRV